MKRKECMNDENILIYQMGKVGSSTIGQSIENNIQFHTLYNVHPCPVKDIYKPRTLSNRLKKLYEPYFQRQFIRSRKKIKIITMARDPYAKNISSFFQNLSEWTLHDKFSKGGMRGEEENHLHKVYDKYFNHEYAINWFDNELEKFTRINIFKHPFDKEQGFQIIKQGKFEVFVFKLEKLNNIVTPLSEFCGTQIVLKNANRGEKKWYSSVYKEFKDTYTPTETYLDLLYNSKFTNHFYTEEEITNFRKKHLRHN